MELKYRCPSLAVRSETVTYDDGVICSKPPVFSSKRPIHIPLSSTMAMASVAVRSSHARPDTEVPTGPIFHRLTVCMRVSPMTRYGILSLEYSTTAMRELSTNTGRKRLPRSPTLRTSVMRSSPLEVSIRAVRITE